MYYTKVIDDFTKAWYKLTNKYDISMTQKIYNILDHLYNYFYDCEVILKSFTDEHASTSWKVYGQKWL